VEELAGEPSTARATLAEAAAVVATLDGGPASVHSRRLAHLRELLGEDAP